MTRKSNSPPALRLGRALLSSCMLMPLVAACSGSKSPSSTPLGDAGSPDAGTDAIAGLPDSGNLDASQREDATRPDGGLAPGPDGGSHAGNDGGGSGVADGSVLFIGRMDTTIPGEPAFQWEGATIEANFTGTKISVSLAGDPSQPNYFAVFMDGVLQPTLVVNGATATTYPLATGLDAGPHQVELFRRAESFQGTTQFFGFELGAGGQLTAPPTAPTRKIEFVGDSITAGYGVECTNGNIGFTAATENEYLAYGSITARDLNAEAHIIAWSGEGVYRDYGSDPDAGLKMPEYWLRTLPTLDTSAWDFALWTPDVVVVNLATNDFSTTPPSDIDAQFQSAYLAFIQTIHSTYPAAYIVCALGPMLSDPHLTEARTAINAVITTMHGSGVADISLVEFPTQDCGTDGGGCGCDFHPSIATQASMATSLEAAIHTAVGW